MVRRGKAGITAATLCGLALLLALAPAGQARTMVVQPDGKILLAGSTPLFSGYLARLQPNGEPDPSFGHGGIVVDHNVGQFEALALEPDGSVLGLGSYTNGLVRYRPDGSLDTGFGTGGYATFPVISDPSELVLLPDGRILVGGDQNHKLFPPQALLVLLLADGRKEEWISGATFRTYMTNLVGNPDGSVLMTTGGVEALSRKSLLGRFVPGSTPSFGEEYSTITYPQPEPGYDKGFGAGAGFAALQWPGKPPPPFAARALASVPGGIFVAGAPGPRLALARFGEDGTFDAGFGGDGFATVGALPGKSAAAADLAVTPEGKPLLFGDFRSRRFSCEYCRTPVLARFLPGGQHDESFGNGGFVRFPAVVGPEHGAEARDLALLPDGDALVAALARERTSRLVLGRVDSSGRPDGTFGRGGVLSFKPCTGSEAAQRESGCLPSADAALQLREAPDGSLFLRLVVSPRGGWWRIESLRVQLPPSLAPVQEHLRRARFSYRSYGDRLRRQRPELRGGALVFHRKRGMEPGDIVLTVPAGVLRQAGGAAYPLDFRVRVGFSRGYEASAGAQTLVVSATPQPGG